MPPEFEALADLLDQAEAMLQAYGQTHWAAWLAEDARRIRSLDASGVEHLLYAFGGMGSLNDVVLQRSHRAAGATVDIGGHDRFDKLRSEIYDLASKYRPAIA